MNFSVLPPEINSLRMFSGAGSGPMLAAAAAWEGLAVELGSAADSFSSVTQALDGSGVAGAGVGGDGGCRAALCGVVGCGGGAGGGTAAQVKAVAGVFEAARAAMVHPLAVAANRGGLVKLVVSNLFGQNAAAIAAVEGRVRADVGC